MHEATDVRQYLDPSWRSLQYPVSSPDDRTNAVIKFELMTLTVTPFLPLPLMLGDLHE